MVARRCVKLEVLEARQNQLATLPSGIGACRMLIELDLAQNQMVMLAPELAGCAKLTILDISGNSVTAPAIPPTLLKATSLAVRVPFLCCVLGHAAHCGRFVCVLIATVPRGLPDRPKRAGGLRWLRAVRGA